MKGFVYFMQCGAEIKVGYTTDLHQRLSGVKYAGRKEVRLIAAVKGGRALELALLKKLRPHRINSEWFRDCRDVRAAIQNTLNNFDAVDVDLGNARDASIFCDIARLLWPEKQRSILRAKLAAAFAAPNAGFPVNVIGLATLSPQSSPKFSNVTQCGM